VEETEIENAERHFYSMQYNARPTLKERNLRSISKHISKFNSTESYGTVAQSAYILHYRNWR